MQKCWNPDPNKRSTVAKILSKLDSIYEIERKNPTNIIKSSDIGPIITNNPGAIYSSRPLSGMIKSAISIRNLRSQFITSELGK